MPTFRRGIRDSPDPQDGPVSVEDKRNEPLDPGAGIPDRRYHITAAELLKPLIEPNSAGILRWRKQATNAPIVQVEDYYITGRLDLRAADLDYLLRFERCRFEYPPDVREAKLLGLTFRKCWLPGLKARNLRTRNDVRLIRCVVQVDAGSQEIADTTVRRADDRDRGMPDAAINFTDASIGGSMVLTRTKVEYPRGKAIQADRLHIAGALLAYRLEAHGEVRLPGMRTGGNVNFSGATLHNPDGFSLNGNGLHIGGSLLCEVDAYGPANQRKRFSSNGVLFLPSARVDSDIVLRGAKLTTNQRGRIVVDPSRSTDPYLDPHPALIADRIRVDGNLELSDGLEATGTIRMVNARIGGSLRLASAKITVLRGKAPPFQDRALHLDGSQIEGDLEATALKVPSGQVRLADVTIGGNILAWGAELSHANRDVFSARRTKIGGNLHLTDSMIKGTLRLQGVEVGGNLDLYGSSFSEPAVMQLSSFSVDLRTAKVGRDVLMTANHDRAFFAEGGVNMDGATVGRRVNFSGSVLRSVPRDWVALDASDVSADEFLIAPKEIPQGRVILRHAKCGTLSDNIELWRATGGLELEDFRYDAMQKPIGLKDDREVAARIELLRLSMDGYRPGPYEQFATMLRSSGSEEHADTVLLKKQQFRYEAYAKGFKFFGPGVRFWSWLQRSMVGYGYRPVRALGWLIALLVLGSVWFGLGSDPCVHDPNPTRYSVSGPRCLVNQQDTGMQWNPVLYTADLLVPIVDFGNKSRWYMAGIDSWMAAGFTAMGWVLATTLAAGASRALRRNA